MTTNPAGVVSELNRRFRAGNRAGALELLARDVRIEQPPSLPHGGTHTGHDGMDAMARAFAEHWSREIEDPCILGCGETVVQVTRQTWTSHETGQAATVDVVELLSVVGGLITEIRVFPQDTNLLVGTLGTRP